MAVAGVERAPEHRHTERGAELAGEVIHGRRDALPRAWLDIWNRWDAPHFFEVARTGYGPPTDPARIVLFPLFPALIALGSLVAAPLVVIASVWSLRALVNEAFHIPWRRVVGSEVLLLALLALADTARSGAGAPLRATSPPAAPAARP